MATRWTTPIPLPNGGLRFIPPTPDRLVGGLLGVGGAAVFLALGTFATVQKPGVEGPGWEVFAALGGLVLVWLRLLFELIFPVGVTLADGRLGLARRVFGRLRWRTFLPAAGVRRLVVRHSGASAIGDLAAGGDGGSLALVVKRGRDDLTAVANELAAGLNAGRTDPVAVGNEETRFTGTRAEQPVFSRLATDSTDDAQTVRLPTVGLEVHRPVTEVRRFGPEFRANLPGYLLGGAVAGIALLYATFAAVVLFWAAGELVLTGQTSQRVRIGSADLSGGSPPPPLVTRLALAAEAGAWAVGVSGITGAFGLWLGRAILRSARRTAARQPATRTSTTRRRNAHVTLTLAADALGLSVVGLPPARFPWADLADVRASHVEHESSGEEGGSTVVEWLELKTTSGEVWKLTGQCGADWEWLATRLRAAAGLPDPVPTTP